MRYRHGLVLGKFYPLHVGHLALVRAALRACDRVTVEVLTSGAESVPGEVRVGWIREEVPQARVVTAVDDAPVDYGCPEAWSAHLAVIEGLLDAPVDAVFTSDAYGAELSRRLGATWERVDAGRVATPVAARAVRADPAGHWWALPPAVRAWFVRRVVVCGAESTGTTTLAADLAAHFGLEPVLEYGREWTAVRPGGPAAPWHTAEFDLVAAEQARQEDDAARRAPVPLLVCDTDPLVTALFHERYVGAPSPSVRALADARVPDLYLLTGDEIPFVQDGMRDGEHIRPAMQARFREVLAQRRSAVGVPWHELRGSRAARLAAAVRLVEPLLATPRPMAEPLPERGAGPIAVPVDRPGAATL